MYELIRWLFGKGNAIKSVEKSLSLFSKIIKDLHRSIDLCNTEIEQKSIEIAIATDEKIEISNSMKKAQRALEKLEEFLD